MSAQGTTKVPPNGGWGWIIVLAYALNGISTASILQGFGLLFKDVFRRFEFTATEGTIIINTNLAFGMLLGLVNGPLLRIFGYRKIAVIGTLLYTIGVTATAFVTTFPLFIVFYGIFASLGLTITLASFSYALNSYFTTKRARALSLAVTIVGLGPIILPQVTTYLISFYGFQGTIMIYGAISFHSLIGSVLLQPIKWHQKSVKNESKVIDEKTEKQEAKAIDEKSINTEGNKTSPNSMLDLSNAKEVIVSRKRGLTVSSIDHDAEMGSIYGFDILFGRQLSETPNISKQFRSVDSINFGSRMTIFGERRDSLAKYSALNTVEGDDCNSRDMMEKDGESDVADKTENQKQSTMTQISKRVVQLFDLDLLQDPIYVNIMLGMSVAIFAEINFSQLTPFILADMNLSTREIATVMSLIATLDLVFRSLAPFIGEWLRQPPRIMYLLSLCFLIISRTSILFVKRFTSMLFIAVGLGAAKGIRSVYMTLVIPTYVSIDKLPNASGIQMIANGIILLSAGPMLGVMRDNIGSYAPCIIMVNCVTALTVMMWAIEMFILWRKRLKLESSQKFKS